MGYADTDIAGHGAKFATLEPIAAFRNLAGLEIATYPDSSFQLLADLTGGQ